MSRHRCTEMGAADLHCVFCGHVLAPTGEGSARRTCVACGATYFLHTDERGCVQVIDVRACGYECTCVS